MEYVAWSPDSRLIATTGDESFLRLWNATSGDRLAEIKTPERAVSLDFSPDSRQLVSGGEAGRVRLWQVDWGDATVPPD